MPDEEKTDRILWLIGGAVVTAFVAWQVNKMMMEKEEVSRLHALEDAKREIERAARRRKRLRGREDEDG